MCLNKGLFSDMVFNLQVNAYVSTCIISYYFASTYFYTLYKSANTHTHTHNKGMHTIGDSK